MGGRRRGLYGDTRTGVVLTNAFDGSGGVMYCVVADSLAAAWDRDRALKSLFSRPPGQPRGTSR
ncbi:peptide ligase PGM1-related protein [Streptomyces puniciscabiei]|uniref:peptide ligase PGM1-related protein n=1 Tax=Streptomyces puniciscabiei TaxID=164348 RepID=UPI00142F1C73|nr:peptide ligase PGM1-related protein [Streptomyces puniciscabiei]